MAAILKPKNFSLYESQLVEKAKVKQQPRFRSLSLAI